jgi:hypothetical protein
MPCRRLLYKIVPRSHINRRVKSVFDALQKLFFHGMLVSMMTIQQTIDSPADRRLYLELPETVPTGNTKVHITFFTVSAKAESRDETLERLLQPLPSLEEFKREAAEKTANRIASGCAPFEEARELLNGRQLFDGVDGVEYQRKMRDEWSD